MFSEIIQLLGDKHQFIHLGSPVSLGEGLNFQDRLKKYLKYRQCFLIHSLCNYVS